MRRRISRSVRGTVVESRKVLNDPRLVLWSLFLVFFPFYIAPSGLPQPADCLILILLPMLLSQWNGRLLDMTRPLRLLVIFTIYATLINVLWTLVLATFAIDLKHGFLLSPTFYIYNAIMLLCVLLMYQRYRLRFIWLTVRVILVSLGLQVIVSFVVTSHALRSSLMFNNPNQLGHYALLSACMLMLGMQKGKLGTALVTLGLIAACYLALMSASKAALGSIAMLGITLMFARLRTMVLATLVALALAFTSNPFSHALERAQQRIATDQSHGLLEERGYDRVIQYPEYWIFGSGEGDYARFADTTVIHSHELHSSAATLFFSYGIIGVLVFGMFLYRALRGASARILFIVMPGFAYGMVHQGLRFTLMWVMLGVAMALRHHDGEVRRAAASARKAQGAAGPSAKLVAISASESARS